MNGGVGSGTVLISRDEESSRWALRLGQHYSRSYTRCLDPWHDQQPMRSCHDSTCTIHGDLRHWHQVTKEQADEFDGDLFLCPGECHDDEGDVDYFGPHWHDRLSLPRKLPDPAKATERAKTHRKNQGKDKR